MATTPRKVHAATTAAAVIALLAGCGGAAEEEATQSPHSSMTSGSSESEHGSGEEMTDHQADGGPPPQGAERASSPTYPVGTRVTLTADHLSGTKGAEASISGAFDTTAYSVSYTPTDGGERVTDHKWVVHEELEDPGKAPLAAGTETGLDADHMTGMDGAEATIDRSTDETVYMVDLTIDGETMTNHKWFVESEIQPRN
ncbi:YdhK family protein [Janibacter cremeus]|nr:YdhK family protein [Janibacter cremeus]WEV77203.1 YdhK family protein [Janibacter cremeus]